MEGSRLPPLPRRRGRVRGAVLLPPGGRGVLVLALVEPLRVGARGADVPGPVGPGAALAAEPGLREEALDVPAKQLEAGLPLELPVDHAEAQGGELLVCEAALRGWLALEAPAPPRLASPLPGQRLRADPAVPREALEQALLVEGLPGGPEGHDLRAPRHGQVGVVPPFPAGAPELWRLDPVPGPQAGGESVEVPVALVGDFRLVGPEPVLVAPVLPLLSGVPPSPTPRRRHRPWPLRRSSGSPGRSACGAAPRPGTGTSASTPGSSPGPGTFCSSPCAPGSASSPSAGRS